MHNLTPHITPLLLRTTCRLYAGAGLIIWMWLISQLNGAFGGVNISLFQWWVKMSDCLPTEVHSWLSWKTEANHFAFITPIKLGWTPPSCVTSWRMRDGRILSRGTRCLLREAAGVHAISLLGVSGAHVRLQRICSTLFLIGDAEDLPPRSARPEVCSHDCHWCRRFPHHESTSPRQVEEDDPCEDRRKDEAGCQGSGCQCKSSCKSFEEGVSKGEEGRQEVDI